MDNLFIRSIKYTPPTDTKEYPFSIPAVKDIGKIILTQPVTFLVGENGTGKSTIIEAIAVAAGFNAEGGTKNYNFTSQNTTSSLNEQLTLIRGHFREKYGYFLRAESFYTTANYAENGTELISGPAPIYFDGKRIHEQSHGEAFMSIVKEFRPKGLYIFDEPESALSPNRLFELMRSIHELVGQGAQFIIATHSPILLAYPATIYEMSNQGIMQKKYDELENIQLTRDFMNHPEVFLQHIIKNTK
ncbi:MAG TPA: AAA family ATPase [Candidatus Saccharimonadales bacterium]|jgi:predicted ATPase|nr:AAA family ATPase [Candidatus Saccharimonadales bacterium]